MKDLIRSSFYRQMVDQELVEENLDPHGAYKATVKTVNTVERFQYFLQWLTDRLRSRKKDDEDTGGGLIAKVSSRGEESEEEDLDEDEEPAEMCAVAPGRPPPRTAPQRRNLAAGQDRPPSTVMKILLELQASNAATAARIAHLEATVSNVVNQSCVTPRTAPGSQIQTSPQFHAEVSGEEMAPWETYASAQGSTMYAVPNVRPPAPATQPIARSWPAARAATGPSPLRWNSEQRPETSRHVRWDDDGTKQDVRSSRFPVRPRPADTGTRFEARRHSMSFPANDHTQFTAATIATLKSKGIVNFTEKLYTETVPCPACNGNHAMIICPSYFLEQRESVAKLTEARKEAIRRRKLWGEVHGSTKGVTMAMLFTDDERGGKAEVPRFDALVCSMCASGDGDDGMPFWEEVPADDVSHELFQLCAANAGY